MLIPALVKLGIPFEYTFTDLSPSLIAQAKRKFKQYPMMKFAVHDIEKPPSDADLVGSQHIVIASNAVHATHSLNVSGQNIRKFLRPDGFLMLLEMMATLHWVDVVWGTLEGWWLFDDGRTHAIVNERRWESELLGAGYKHVEWTDGELAENRVQRILIALAADVDQSLKHLPKSSPTSSGATHGLEVSDEDMQIRKKAADNYVKTTAEGFAIPKYSGPPITFSDSANSILVTGGTGSLGSHIVAHLARLPSVDTVYCLNRPGPRIGPSSDPLKRQIQALENKGIKLDESMLNKLEVIGTDASKPRLGLDADQYDKLSSRLTHIIHNAFPVNGLLTMKQNEPQYAIMRNLIDFAAGVAARRKSDPSSTFKFTFQFVSSQAAVGRYPYVNKGKKQVPEEAQDVECALPNGYGGAKVVCERVLVETLGKHPDCFRSMTVRLGQLSGSTETGYWNHMEVLGFLFKSAQTLRAFPAVKGVLSWLPLEDASATLADLILRDGSECYPFYHVDNPVLKEWDEVIPVLAEALDIPNKGIVSLQEWLRRVRLYPGEDPWDNPAAKTQDFFEHKFLHMSCGGIYLATDRAREHSPALRAAQPVSDDLVRKYIQAFKTSGFLR
jgi:nucleoside-diphosphate-sugar epimerase